MNTWPTKKLGEVCEIEYGTRIVKSRTEPGQYYVYGGGGKTFETVNYNRESRIIIARFAMSPNCVRRIQGRFFLNDSGLTLSPKNRAKLTQDFLDTFLFSIENKIFSLGRGQAQKNLNIGEFINLPIPLPPLSEQKKIVEKIEKLFAKIDEANRLRAESSAASAALLPSALYHIFNGTKHSNILKNVGMSSDGWEEKELGDLFEITSSKRVFKSEWKETGIPFYRARELVSLANNKPFKNPIFISEKMYEQYKSKYGIPKEGDILVTGVGTIGISYAVKRGDKFYFKDGNIIWLKKISNINSRFVEYFFKSSVLKDRLKSLGVATVVGTFTITTAKSTKIPLPPIAEQKKIVAYLDALSQKTRELQNLQKETAADFSALRQSILAKAFRKI